jgi:hypothetical protein
MLIAANAPRRLLIIYFIKIFGILTFYIVVEAVEIFL